MNKDRRKTLSRLSDELSALRGKIEDLRNELEACKDKEQDYFDNMPESLQGGDKGQTAEASVDAMDNAMSSLDTALSELDDASNSLAEAEGTQ